ncbi:MAG: hypothetical protein AB1733_08810 [Thermodesulfobacteriota bacterium]
MGAPTKAQQIFLYIAPFPALAFFKIWASPELVGGTPVILSPSNGGQKARN